MRNFTEDEYAKITKLTILSKEYGCFVYEDLVVEGNRVAFAKEYVFENPSKKYRTWLLDRKIILKEI